MANKLNISQQTENKTIDEISKLKLVEEVENNIKTEPVEHFSELRAVINQALIDSTMTFSETIESFSDTIRNNFKEWSNNGFNMSSVLSVVETLKNKISGFFEYVSTHAKESYNELEKSFSEFVKTNELSIDEVQRQNAKITQELGTNDVGCAIISQDQMGDVLSGEKDLADIADESLVTKPELPPKYENKLSSINGYVTQGELNTVMQQMEKDKQAMDTQQLDNDNHLANSNIGYKI